MFSQQRENGIGLVIEFQLRSAEAPGRMAGLAIPGKLPEMHVGVAIAAGRRQGFVGHGLVCAFFGVAFLARQGGVLSGQGKARLAVIKRYFFETVHHMAGLAILAELAAMGILAMAIGAVGESDFLVFFSARMTLNACQGAVFSPQWEPGLVMVELGGFPGILAVAGAAVLSPGRLVGIRVAIAAAG